MNIKNFYLVYGEPQMSCIKGEASMKEYNISTMTYKEMLELHNALEQEMAAQQEATFNHLVKNVCDAIAELRSVFPHATFNVTDICEECCEATAVKVFAFNTETIAPHFFSMY